MGSKISIFLGFDESVTDRPSYRDARTNSPGNPFFYKFKNVNGVSGPFFSAKNDGDNFKVVKLSRRVWQGP